MSTHHPSFTRSSGIGNVFKSWTSTFKTSNSKPVPVQINPTVVGGGRDQKKLFLQLQSGPLPQRASTAVVMTESIKNFTISSIPEIWYLARDMCNPKIQSYIRRITIKLMIECIKNDDLTSTSTKLMYFRDIVMFCQLSDYKTDQEFDLFLSALRKLTNDGRDIQDLCILQDKVDLPKFLNMALSAAGRHVKNFSDKISDEKLENDVNYQNLISLLVLIKNCVKFNPHTIDELSISHYTKKAIQMALKTTNVAILLHCIEVLSTTVIFTSLPQASLFEVVEFLCTVYGSNDQLTELSWHAIAAFSSQAAFYQVRTCLRQIITNDELASFKSTLPENALTSVTSNTTISTVNHSESNSPLTACVGAIQIIERFSASPSVWQTNDSILLHFLPDLVYLTSFDVPVLNTALLRSLDRLFSKQAYSKESGANLNSVMDQIYLFQLWCSSKSSIYDLLNHVKLLSDIDINYWKSICASLQNSFDNHELVTSREKLVSLFTTYYQHLSLENVKFVLKYYSEEKLLTVLSPFAEENCMKILNYFYFNTENSKSDLVPNENLSEIRIEVLKAIKSSFDISHAIDGSSFKFELVIDILKRSVYETDENVLQYLKNDLFVKVVMKAPYETFEKICDRLLPFFELKQTGRLKSLVSLNSSGIRTSQLSNETVKASRASKQFKTAITKGFVSLLIIESTQNAQKALEAFRCCIYIAQHALLTDNCDLLLIVLKGLMRIRVSDENNIYFTNPTDMEGLASAFGRSTSDSKYTKDYDHKWTFPDQIDYIDSRYFDSPLYNLKIFDSKSEKLRIDTDVYFIDIEVYFSIVLDVLSHFINWEIFSFVWAHFCTQLANMDLFINSREQLLHLKNIVCEQLQLHLPQNFSFPEHFSKSDLQVACVRMFSSLIGYHEYFMKSDEDDMIRSLLFGIDSWEKTAIPSIHILTACCYEIPLSIKKYLSIILAKLQTKVTSIYASSHILEFLMCLINNPSLTSSLNVDDVKRIFGISFKFIQYSSDAIANRSKQEQGKEIIARHGVDASIDNTPSTQISQEHVPILLHYVLTLSHNVVSTWFLKLDVSVRRKLSSFVLRNLVSVNSDDKILDDQTIAYVDLIIRFTYSDLPLKMVNPKSIIDKLKANDGNVTIGNWMVGYSIATVATNSSNGETLMILRRPTGVAMFRINLDTNLFASTRKYSNTSISPNYILLQWANTVSNKNEKPLPLIDDPITIRALSTLDRIPIVEFHKIGLLYIGKGQTQEAEVLGNRGGSRLYQEFVHRLGDLIKLKNCKDIYAGGLDTENGSDGDYAVYWNDKTVQVVFHTTSLMPNHDKDIYFESKKRHIGNNYVNIFFDESGSPFNFNIIKSQFNFINIVISPHTKSFSTYSNNDNLTVKFFKVKLYRRSGVPAVFSTCHFKLISQELLPSVIRNLAITANQFANVWHSNSHDKFVSNWVHRVRQIRTLKERTVATHEELKQEQLNDGDNKPGVNDATQSFLQQLEFDGAANTTDSTHRYEYTNENDNELYSMIEFNSYT